MEGLITYHRTDSTTLSDKALQESARVIREMFGAGVLRRPAPVSDAREERAGSARGHPADRLQAGAEPARGRARHDELKVYELIWKRTMASQMVDARVLRTTIEIIGEGPGGEMACSPRAARRSSLPASAAPTSKAVTIRPPNSKSRKRSCRSARSAIAFIATADGTAIACSVPSRSGTRPPPARFTEASLIKELERLGIGRPSTYAPTIATIVRRGYVFRQGKALVPSFTAFAVTKLLRDHFGDFVESDFTAEMEDDLDEISRANASRSVPARVLLRRQAEHVACWARWSMARRTRTIRLWRWARTKRAVRKCGCT